MEINTEDETDRSKHCAGVLFKLFNAGLTDDEVEIVATGSAFARKFDERGDLHEEIVRVRAGWTTNGDKKSEKGATEEEESEAEDTAEPLPLTQETEPLEYPVQALGPILGGAALAMRTEVVQAPLGLCCNAVLAGASFAVQPHANVLLPADMLGPRPLSLFLLAIADSSERKTTVDNITFEALTEHEAELRTAYLEKFVSHKAEHAAWTDERSKIKNNKKLDRQQRELQYRALGPEPVPPPFPLFRCSEPTIEGLVTAMKSSQPNVCVTTNEGAQFIGSYAMDDSGTKVRSTATLNKFWDGSPVDRVRVKESFTLVGRRLSLHLQAQPDIAAKLISDPILLDNGFLSRMLATAPAPTAGTRFFILVSEKSREALEKYKQTMLTLLRRPLPHASCGGSTPEQTFEYGPGPKNEYELAPRAIKFEAAAELVWWDFYNEIEARLKKPDGDLVPISGLAGKMPEHAARIAGVLTLFENHDAKTISKACLQRGITLAEHYLGEAMRLSGLVAGPATTEAAVRIGSFTNDEVKKAEMLRRWLRSKWSEEYITIRAITRSGPNQLRDSRTAKRIVKALESYGYLLRATQNVIVEGRKCKQAWKIVKEQQ